MLEGVCSDIRSGSRTYDIMSSGSIKPSPGDRWARLCSGICLNTSAFRIPLRFLPVTVVSSHRILFILSDNFRSLRSRVASSLRSCVTEEQTEETTANWFFNRIDVSGPSTPTRTIVSHQRSTLELEHVGGRELLMGGSSLRPHGLMIIRCL